MQLKKASRKKVKLKLNMSGPTGAGKTMSALLMAYGLVGDWEKIAVIDTENGSASLYDHLGAYNTIDLAPPFHPDKYVKAIDLCLESKIECVVIDSASHEWSGTGGVCDINENVAQVKYKGNTWSSRSETSPIHQRFVDKILQSDIHVITCSRSKMETVMDENKKVKKLGMKDIQHGDWEYDFTVSLNIDRDTHMATSSKDRTGVFENLPPFVITEQTGKLILEWCNSGKDVKPMLNDAQLNTALERISKGEVELAEKLNSTFALTEEQKEKLQLNKTIN